MRCGDLRLFLREHVTEDCWVTEGLFFADEYYPLKISRDDVVLDVGANIGIFTCRTSKRANEVISIEPDPSNFEVLKKECGGQSTEKRDVAELRSVGQG